MNVSEIKEILQKNNLFAKKRLDQHFLYDEELLRREVKYAGVTGDDNVLEIGPGLGTLTQEILKKAGSVTVIELDKQFKTILDKINGISIIIGDALEVDWKNLCFGDKGSGDQGNKMTYEAGQRTQYFSKILSNVPYSISSPLIFKILDYGPETAVLCLQKEFAERMIATVGTKDYSRLSVNCAVRARIELLERISKAKYWPVPKVDSAIVRLTPTKEFDLPRKFDAVVRAAFQHKNQKLGKALMHSWHEIECSGTQGRGKSAAQKKSAKKFIAKLGAVSERKVFTIAPEEFVEISGKF